MGIRDSHREAKVIIQLADCLFQRGWRASDRALLKKTFEYSDDVLDLIVAALRLYE